MGEQDNTQEFDLDKLDPNQLDASARPFYDSMLRDYRSKTEGIANRVKDEVAKAIAEREEAWTQEREAYKNTLSKYEEANNRWATHFQQQQNQPQRTDEDDEIDGSTVTVGEMKRAVTEMNKAWMQQFEGVKKVNADSQRETAMILALQDQMNQLQLAHQGDEEFDVTAVVKHAKEMNTVDLRRAAKDLYGERDTEKRIKEAEERAFEKAKTEIMAELDKRSMEEGAFGRNSAMQRRSIRRVPASNGQQSETRLVKTATEALEAAYDRWAAEFGASTL